MFSDVENERSHVATETGMLKQDFSAINVSLNNSWVTGGIAIDFWLLWPLASAVSY